MNKVILLHDELYYSYCLFQVYQTDFVHKLWVDWLFQQMSSQSIHSFTCMHSSPLYSQPTLKGHRYQCNSANGNEKIACAPKMNGLDKTSLANMETLPSSWQGKWSCRKSFCRDPFRTLVEFREEKKSRLFLTWTDFHLSANWRKLMLTVSLSVCAATLCATVTLWLCVWGRWHRTVILHLFNFLLPTSQILCFIFNGQCALLLLSIQQVQDQSVLMNVFSNWIQSGRRPLRCEMWGSCDLLSHAGGRGTLCVSAYERRRRWRWGAAGWSQVFGLKRHFTHGMLDTSPTASS